MDACTISRTLPLIPAMRGCGGSCSSCSSSSSNSSDGDEKSSGSVEEEEEEDDEATTMVMTYEGSISDPMLRSKLSCLMHRLKYLSNSERLPEVQQVEPWNSVRVTFSIPREAARRLHLLAQAGEPALRHLGILSVQVQGDQVVCLRLAGTNNESNDLTMRTSDSASSSSNMMDRLSGILGSSSANNPSTSHHPHLHHHQQQHPQQVATAVQYRAPAPPPPPPSLPGFYSQASGGGIPGQHAGTMVVRSSNTPQQTLLHHRPAAVTSGGYNTTNNPPPYPLNSPADHHHNSTAATAVPHTYMQHSAADQAANHPSSPVAASYRLTPVSANTAAAAAAGGGMVVAATSSSGGRQVIVRPPPPPPSSQLIQQQPPATSTAPVVNVVKNSPLLVGLLQQPEQQNKAAVGIGGSPELGSASTHLTSLAANHYTANHTSALHHHRPIVNSSINQYSSTTRSRDGLTTHQQVYSGGSVITNARVPVAGGLQQHPQVTGKPPPMTVGASAMTSSAQAGTIPSGVIQQQQPLAGPALTRHAVPLQTQQQPQPSPQHHPTAGQQQIILGSVAGSGIVVPPSSVSSSSGSSIAPQSSVLTSQRTLVPTAGTTTAMLAAASPSPAISPTPSLPSPHPTTHTSLSLATVVSQMQTSVTTAAASVGGISAFVGSHVTALTPPLTPSNQQILSTVSSASHLNTATSSSPSISANSDDVSAMTPVSQIEAHTTSATLTQVSPFNSQIGMDSKVTKAASPKRMGSKESQYLINPNTGLLEPRHNTDSSDSESDLRPFSPVQKSSQTLQNQSKSAAPTSTSSSSSSSLLLNKPQSEAVSQTGKPVDKLLQTSLAAAAIEESSISSSSIAVVTSISTDAGCERPASHDSTTSSSSSSNNSVSSKETQHSELDSPRLVTVLQPERAVSKQKSEQSNNNDWVNSRIVRAQGSGELRLKLKFGREQPVHKNVTLNARKNDKKDVVVTGSSSSSELSSDVKIIPKLHIKFGPSVPHVVKQSVPVPTSVSEDKDRSRKVVDKGREDRKRKGCRKRSRNSDCESDRLDIHKLKSGSIPESSVLKMSDIKKAKLDHESEDGGSFRGKDSNDGRSKGPRTFEDKYSNKVDNVKMAKFEAKRRTRSKIKTPLQKLGSIFGELTSHKILETLPPSITKVAALHTQQPHRNPTSSSSVAAASCSSFFSSSDKLDSDFLRDSGSSADDCLSIGGKGSGLMNGDLSYEERGALSRSLQSSTFSELTAGGKLTIKRKPASLASEHLRSSLSLLNKDSRHADAKRKMGLGCIPTYLNSSLLINKVSTLGGSSGYSRLHDTDRGRQSASSTASAISTTPSSSSVGGTSANKGGELLKTALCANFPSLNANSDITIQSVRSKKDLLASRLSGGSDEQHTRSLHHKSPGHSASMSLPDGLNKAGRVTCIDVTDRKAVEEAVKSSRNSSSNTDSQQKLADALERWSCSSTVVSTATSSHNSSCALPTNNNSNNNNLATRLQPDSTNYFPTSLSVESKDASGDMGSKTTSSSQCPVEQNPRDSDTGKLKSHVKTSLVSRSNCDTRVKGEVMEVSVEDCSGKVEVGSSSSGGNVSGVATSSKPSADIESPEGTPKGEHGTGQGGEDSGIESMDALSEKSPNQSDQSPHRRDDKECDAFVSDSSKPVAVANCSTKAIAASPSSVALSVCTSTVTVVTPTTVAASSIAISSSKSKLLALDNSSSSPGQLTAVSSVGTVASAVQTNESDSSDDREQQKAFLADSAKRPTTTDNSCDVYQYDIEKEAAEDIKSNITIKDKESRIHLEESRRKQIDMNDSNEFIERNIRHDNLNTKSNLNTLLRVKSSDVNNSADYSELNIAKTSSIITSSLTKVDAAITSIAPSPDITITSKRHDGAIILTPSGKTSNKPKPLPVSKLNSQLGNSSDVVLSSEENGLNVNKTTTDRRLSSPPIKVSDSSNVSLNYSNNLMDSHDSTKKLTVLNSHESSATDVNNSNCSSNSPMSSATPTFTVVNPNPSTASLVSPTAMIFLSGVSSGSATSTGSSVSTAKVVTLKSASFSNSSSSALAPPAGKAFRLVSLPDNLARSPASSPVKGQLVTFKQLVPSSGVAGGSTRSPHLVAATASPHQTPAKTDDSPPSLLKAQLLAPQTNAHHNYTYVSGIHAQNTSNSIPVVTTNGEPENLDFVGFSSSSIIKLQPSVTKIAQLIPLEKEEKSTDLLSPTEDEPKPLRVQPPLYTYGGNKDRKKDLETDTDDKEKPSVMTPEKDACNNVDIKLEHVVKEESKIDQSNKPQSNDRGFNVLTIEIPATNNDLLDDKRLTRATRQSARLASPKVNSPNCELSPRTSERRSPSTLNNIGVSGSGCHVPSLCSVSNPSMSSLVNTPVSISGRLVANSGSITITSLTRSCAPATHTTRSANKKRRHEIDGSSNDYMLDTSNININSKIARRKASEKYSTITAVSCNKAGSNRTVQSTGVESSDNEEEEDYDNNSAREDNTATANGSSNNNNGVVVIGVASCLAEVAAASAVVATAVNTSVAVNNSAVTVTVAAPGSSKRRTPSASNSLHEDEEEAPRAADQTTHVAAVETASTQQQTSLSLQQPTPLSAAAIITQ
uniref:Mucin-4-like isoform X2 n=3 Tax=Hirondellea gigas TaxID=1518452 RepID=A0A6A7FXE8_9CRUS